MNTYAQYQEFMRGRDVRTIPSIRGTLVRRDGTAFKLMYHNTVVVTAYADGSFTLNTGGWLTATTKQRLNDFSPAMVYQRKHQWYVMLPDQAKTHADQAAVPFFDGIRVDAIGAPLTTQEA